jgi:L-alanine-DL-glutamate epimerase-like enolase superfamily enzyme
VKIERMTPFLVDRCLLVRVYTDEGIVGTGEAGLWAHHPMVYAAINELYVPQ